MPLRPKLLQPNSMVSRRGTTTTPTLRRRRNGSTNVASPVFWIGIGMATLVFLYVGVVLLVTSHHLTQRRNNVQLDEFNNSTLEKKKAPSALDQINAAHAERKAAKVNNNAQLMGEKEKTHDFRRGVQPYVLLPHADVANLPVPLQSGYTADDHPTPERIMTAYLEPLNRNEWDMKPLPLRQYAHANQLTAVPYPHVRSCAHLTQQLPTDDPPTTRDPFLPWLHDVFPTFDGKFIEFVAQNKRRCQTGRNDGHIMAVMEAQTALFQHVPVQRVQHRANGTNKTRYQLVNHDQADTDGVATRFICQFSNGMETLSTFHFDYDWTAFGKQHAATFKQDEGGIKSIHTSQLTFRCPVPAALHDTIRTGQHVHADWTNVFVTLVPLRTPPRFGPPHRFLQPKYAEFNIERESEWYFDPMVEWGNAHVFPAIENSGRMANIPICLPSLMQYAGETTPVPVVVNTTMGQDRPVPELYRHRLVSCIWASTGYTTRGNRFAINDGQRRLLEWMTYNMQIGFDHFYLYDNSGAFGGGNHSLKPIADLLGADKVTYVPWPAAICNNRPNNVDSPGERSSQYAAESSCRLRFGPHVEWIGQFDIDEYFVPMGAHDNALQLLDELDRQDTRIVSFGSWRAWPRWAYVAPIVPIRDKDICWSRDACFALSIPMEHTMLQAYNCDRQKPGQKQATMPAEKQFYKAAYVLQHFIHYSSVTKLSIMNRAEADADVGYKRRMFPDQRQRFGNELTEGLMIHTKAVAIQDTVDWERVCHIDNMKRPKKAQGLCRLGVPWPNNNDMGAVANATAEGWAYNCFVNEKAEKELIPKLNAAMAKYRHIFDEAPPPATATATATARK